MLGIAGAMFQVVGVVLAVWGTGGIVSAWLKALRDRTLGPKPVTMDGAGLAAGSAEVHGYVDVKIGGTPEDQFVAIKNQLNQLAKTLHSHDKRMKTLTKEAEKGFEEDRAERERLDNELRTLIQANARRALAGAILVVIGIVLSAAAPWF